MKIVAGLGNPGPKYRNTRHNVGFRVADALAADLGAAFDREKHGGLMAQAQAGRERVLIVKPLTFMNRSGDCLAQAARNKIQDYGDLLAVVDDVNLPLGKLRFRRGGSAGGHNGLKSIIERLGTAEFARLRLGVGRAQDGAGALTEHVLGAFLPDEAPIVAQMIDCAVQGVRCFLLHGVGEAMNRFN